MSVFLSYRREDSAGYAGRLFEHLTNVFGADRVFMDVQDIAPGQDFAQTIEATISTCQAVVVVIGPRWVADLREREKGEDFVRHEVAVALRRNTTVIPVLVGGSAMPSPENLPENLAPLSRRQAVEVRDASFENDVQMLVAALQNLPGLKPARTRPRLLRLGWLLAPAVLLVGAGFFYIHQRSTFEIGGVWIVEMKKQDQTPFSVRLNFENAAGELMGSVQYPTGEGSIQSGKVERGRLTFVTVHVPQFASAPATIRWSGVIEGDSIRFTEADDNGVANGVARRPPPTSK